MLQNVAAGPTEISMHAIASGSDWEPGYWRASPDPTDTDPSQAGDWEGPIASLPKEDKSAYLATVTWTYHPWENAPGGNSEVSATGKYCIAIPEIIMNDEGETEKQRRIHIPTGVSIGRDKNAMDFTSLGNETNFWILFIDPPSGEVIDINTDFERAGPKIDVLRGPVIRHPDAALIAMQTGTADVSTDLIRTGDIEKLQGDGDTVTFVPGFHMGHIGYNIRPLAIQQERRPELTVWPLNDVWFRYALFQCYDQESIVAGIYGYTVTPVTSLVPPAQGGWRNPAVTKPPYNPGDPITATSGDGTACGTLLEHDYTFVDANDNDVVDQPDYWECPNGDPVPYMELWTPTYETAPTSADHGARFVADLDEIGLAAIETGDSGIYHQPREFEDYMAEVDEALFDCYMVFWSLGRFPDHLYDMCHSSQDVYYYPKRYNKPGINDPEIDRLVEIIKKSLNHADKMAAAYDVQEMLYDPTTSDSAMSYMQLYSRIYFNGFNEDLRGIINSPGYGAANGWTYANMHWAEGKEHLTAEGKTLINWIWGEPPELLNPCYASTVYAWDVIDKTLDGFIAVNPYTHVDKPSMASKWVVQKWAREDWLATILDPPIEGIDTHWHESYPKYSTNWFIDDWVDNGDMVFSTSDYVLLKGDPRLYHVDGVTWDIKVEALDYGYNELILKGPSVNYVTPTLVPTPGMLFTELWSMEDGHDNFGTVHTVTDWLDTGDVPSGDLTRSDYIQLDGTWYHTDSVTITLELDWNDDDVADKYIEFVGLNEELTGMKISFWIRPGTFWQCGRPFDAYDAKFNWLFLRDNQIPRYTSFWEYVDDVAVVDNQDLNPDLEALKVVIYFSITSQFLLYDAAGSCAILPPPVWEPWDGQPLADILAYDPSIDTTPKAGMGPWFGAGQGHPSTCLYGTGPFVFEYWDPVGMVVEMHQSVTYFETSHEMQEQLEDMFYAVGDINRDGLVWADDRGQMGLLFGMIKGLDPEYDENVDVNKDGIIDMGDITVANYFFGKQKEYP
jgi:ABC-type transport system substrate-binding protein